MKSTSVCCWKINKASRVINITASIWFCFAPPKFLLNCVPQKFLYPRNVRVSYSVGAALSVRNPHCERYSS